jgi:arylsulfatase A-like enzyme
MKHARRPGLLSLAVTAAASTILALATCAPTGPRPNIVIIIMDTARQDHVSCYGHGRRTTPNLDELARESTVFREAYSVSSWTAPSHASLFTGLYPVAHGCTQENWTLREDVVTLAEALKLVGYQTHGITENPTISASAGFGQGFDSYREIWRPADYGDENPAYHLLQGVLAKLDRETPFFLFVNFIEPHAPYNSSRQFIGTYVEDPESGPNGNHGKDFYIGRVTRTDEDFRHMKALYDAEILYTDHQIGRIVRQLKAEGMWDETIFIVTSDHGENIGDHGHMEHYFSLHETTVRIPLMIHYPDLFAPGAEDTQPTQLTDLFPTLMNHLGLDPGEAQGIDLLDPTARTNRPLLCEFYWPAQALHAYGEDWDEPALNRWKRHLRAVIYGGDKLIWASDGDHELYDLAEDPEELHNLIAAPEAADKTEALTVLMNSLIARYGTDSTVDLKPGGPELDEETLEALRALGYVQ